QGRALCLHRRPHRLPGGDRRRLPAGGQPDLHRPPRPPVAALPLLEGTQELRRRAQADLHRRRRRRRPAGPRRAHDRLGGEQDPHRRPRGLGTSLGAADPLPRLPRGDPPHRLHHQHRREPAHADQKDAQARARPRRIRATYTRPHGVRHLLCALDVGADLLSGERTERKTRVEFLAFCERIRARYPLETRLAFVLDNFSVHKGDEMRTWAAANNVELAYTPHYASWLNRIEPQFKGLRHFGLDGTDHPDHATQTQLIADYIDWRNTPRDTPKLRHLTRPTGAPQAARALPANVA